MLPRRKRRAESGQAAIEAALTLPLAIFTILGVLQLFMMLQARIIAQYAVYKAVRAGSLNSGDCQAMTDAAVAALLPTITKAADPDQDTDKPFVDAYKARKNNRYSAKDDDGYGGHIVEFVRELPQKAPNPEDFNFDQPQTTAQIQHLEVRMIYWYRLRIPFADWVMGYVFLAYFGLQNYTASNPLMPAQRNADWTKEATLPDEGDWPGGSLTGQMVRAARAKHFIFPIKVNSVMRMMTPPASAYLDKQCTP